ncbi:Uncharacterised protein [Mycobacteroides abscessus subsp. abscessus]|nr:Uncharacterised protein [Mycobacteroides abscessus subsp. abscessus]
MSLSSLSPSTSISTTTMSMASRRPRCSRSIAEVTPRRFNRPVSGSLSAASAADRIESRPPSRTNWMTAGTNTIAEITGAA